MSEAPRVLLVDDDPDLLKLLSLRLAASGYRVDARESAESALASIAAFRPQAVITDLRMQGMDGMALFDAIQREHASLPVIILTAHGTIPEAVAATRRGVFSFLTKPVDAPDLLLQLEKALQVSGGSGGSGDGDRAWREGIITRSPVMEDLLAKARLVAAGDAPVTIRGESGTGKELLARAIHHASQRAANAFVAVNCAAIPEQLLESELFGHVKGAFTGATRDREGLFQAAHRGTLFLDEIGDMPMPLQVKLLRVLEEKQVRPVGSNRAVPVDVRIVSASHRDLEARTAGGHFREDLFYRLNVVSLALPALGERREDIPMLAGHFLREIAPGYQKSVTAFAPEAVEALVSATWPGNVRQLRNVVEQAVALSTAPVIPAWLVQQAIRQEQEAISSLEDARSRFERDYLVRLLKITEGNVTQAARLAQRNRTEFYKLLKRHHLDPALFKA